MQPFDVVRVQAIRDDRFADRGPGFERNPQVGDIGTILDTYDNPEFAFEVECSNLNGETIWLEAMYPDELFLVQEYPPR